MKKALLITIAGLAVVIVGGCPITENRPNEKKLPNPASDEAGVVVEGYNSNGYVLNKNEFPLRVECLYVYPHAGAIPQWIRVLQPGEKVLMYITMGFGWNFFYVYDLNGVKIGFVVPKERTSGKGAKDEK